MKVNPKTLEKYQKIRLKDGSIRTVEKVCWGENLTVVYFLENDSYCGFKKNEESELIEQNGSVE